MGILIAGGSGFLGSILSKAFVAGGEKVYILTRAPERFAASKGIEWLKWNGRTPSGWQDIIEKTDVVLNLAGDNIGGGLWTPEKKKRIETSRLQAGAAISEAIKLAKIRPKLLIQTSGVGYYGVHSEGRFEENDPAGEDWLARLSVLWEDSTSAVESLGVRRVVTRVGLVFDPAAGILPRYMLPFRFFIGGRLGSGKQWVSWIHREDYVRSILFFVNNPQARGVFNLCAPGVVRYEELGKTLGKAMRRPYWVPAPAFALKFILGEMSTLVLDGQNAYPKRLLEAGFKFNFPDIQSALSDLFQKA